MHLICKGPEHKRAAKRIMSVLAGTTGLVAPALFTPAAAQAPTPTIEQVTVTAERFETSVQRSSLDIQVLGSAELERQGVTNALDLNKLVPGLQIGTGGGAAQIYIRGVGDFAASALSNPAVAVNVDGVYVARPQAVNSNFYDLARIEVLKGPQGTLYGRNASGGAVNLITNAPQLGEVDGFIMGELGDHSNERLEGAVNLPLGDTVAARGSFLVVDRGGYLSDGTDDDVRQAGRLRVLWQPSDKISLILNGDLAHEGGNGPGYVMLPRPHGADEWESASSPRSNAQLAATPPVGFLLSPIGHDSFRDNDFWNVSAEFNWNLGPATLTIIPAYRDAQISERNYPAGLRNIWDEHSKETTVEARLGHSDERLTWVLGGYYFHEVSDSEQQIFQAPFQDNDGFYSPRTTSYAAFGQATYSITENFRLIGGARYTRERKSVDGVLNSFGFPLEVFGGKDSFSNVTWKAGAEYDVTPDSMVYFTASTGFKAGGFNQTVAPMDTYDPEKLTAYSLGARNRFMDGRLQVNVEAFHWDYKDAQIAHVVFDPLGNVNFVTQNAGSATIQGANVDLIALIGDSGRLHFFAEYTDAEYDKFRYDTAYSIFGAPLFNPASTGCQAGTPFPGTSFGTELVNINCDGFQLPRSPKWSISAGYDHTFTFGNESTLNAAINMQYASERWLSFDFVKPGRADSYVTFDFDLAYYLAGGHWMVAGYVHNITNETVYTGGGEQAFAPPLMYATISAPRTVGIRLRYNLH